MKNGSFSIPAVSAKECPSLDILPIALFLENNMKRAIRKHVQSNYEIIWIQEGSGVHTINQTNHQLSGNMVYSAIPGQRHRLAINPGSSGYIISFTESFLSHHYNAYSTLHEENFFHRLLQHPELSISPEVAADMQDVILLLLKETTNNYTLGAELVINYLKIFMIYLQRQLEVELTLTFFPKNNALLKHFLRLLEKNFKEKKAVSQYAKDLLVTPNHLNRVLKSTTGFSARRHIQQRIILEAKRKAQQTGTRMKEIAYDLGFTDIAHFSKYFKNTSGVNFRSFKKETTDYSVTER